jgi:hypothetical protein
MRFGITRGKRLRVGDSTGLTRAEVPDALKMADVLEREGREIRLTITDFMLADAGADPTIRLPKTSAGERTIKIGARPLSMSVRTIIQNRFGH